MDITKLGVIYLRISDDAEGKRLGVARQEEDCRELAARDGVTVVRVFMDNDIGASTRTKKKRRDYPLMIEGTLDQEWGNIYSYSSSRLTRRPREIEDLFELYDETKVQITTRVSGRWRLEDADGRQAIRHIAAADAGEAERTGERLARRQKKDWAEGRYTASKRAWGWGWSLPDPNGKKVLVDPHRLNDTEGPALRWGIGRALEGASLRSIALEWNRQGLPTASGNAWTTSRVKECLLRYRNAGIMQRQEKVKAGLYRTVPVLNIPGAWEAVCTPEDLALLTGMLTSPDRRTTLGRTPSALLSSLAHCGLCGRVMYSGKQRTPRKDGPNWFGVYRCSGAQDTTGNKCWTSIKRETLDLMVVHAVRQRFIFGPPSGLTPSPDERAELMALRTERSEIVNEQVEIGKMIGSRAMSASTAGPALAGLSERLDGIDSDIRSIESRYALGAVLQGQKVDLFERGAQIGRNFRELSVPEQREVVKALFVVQVHSGRDPEERVKITAR